MVCLGRAYDFKIFKGCLPQYLFGPFLNTFTRLQNVPIHYPSEKSDTIENNNYYYKSSVRSF